jgi:hypothetical protein
MLGRNVCGSVVLAIVLTIVLTMLPLAAGAGDISGDVEKVLRQIHQDRPVPSLDYLRKVEPINAGCACYRGVYRGIAITVETHQDSDRVASLLLEIPGPDRTKEVFPAVRRVIGPERYRKPKQSEYGWEWSDFRTASVHYVKGTGPDKGVTVVCRLYR